MVRQILLFLAAIFFLSGQALPDGRQALSDERLGERLIHAKHCTSCHTMDKKRVGPAWRDVAARYAAEQDALARLAIKIQKGGSGAWGPVPMPAHPGLSAQEAEQLARWVLSRPPAAP